MGYLLAYDVGTTRTKAVLVSEDGRVLASAYEPYPTYYPGPLQAEQEPEDWWKAMAKTARAVLANGRALLETRPLHRRAADGPQR